jgi:hypothetical protein
MIGVAGLIVGVRVKKASVDEAKEEMVRCCD